MTNRLRPFGDISGRLIWHREEVEHLTQKDDAGKIGVKRSTLNNWESGEYRLSLDGALAIRDSYGLSHDFLYLGCDDELPLSLRQAWRNQLLIQRPVNCKLLNPGRLRLDRPIGLAHTRLGGFP